jgi:hypothetical protein
MIAARCLVQQIADAGGHVWLNGDSVRVAAHGPLPNAIVEQLRQDKQDVVKVLRLLPDCCECGATLLEPVSAWWGGRPVHLDCGKRACVREWRKAAPSAPRDSCMSTTDRPSDGPRRGVTNTAARTRQHGRTAVSGMIAGR